MINRRLRDLSLPIPDEATMHDPWLGLVSAALGKNDYVQEPTLLHRLHGTNVTGHKSNASVKAITSQLKDLNRLKHESKEYLIKTQRQAMVLSSRYKDLLNDEDFKKILTYANLYSQNYFLKRFHILKYGFWWSGITRNIALFLLV
ncbi:MAG: hypothetical protein NTX81_08590 [Candidatus Bathyarchaeota archaeon]|nr:hypothetical protein [Candidatus Bathyarchaeota archaeon]